MVNDGNQVRMLRQCFVDCALIVRTDAHQPVRLVWSHDGHLPLGVVNGFQYALGYQLIQLLVHF